MFRKTDVRIWKDKKFRQLTPQAKLFFWYAFSNEHTHVSGVYYLPIAYMMADLAMGEPEIKNAIRDLENLGMAHYDEQTEWIFIPNMFRHQGRNPKTARAAEKNLSECESEHCKTWFYAKNPDLHLRWHGVAWEEKEQMCEVAIPYRKGIEQVSLSDSREQVAGRRVDTGEREFLIDEASDVIKVDETDEPQDAETFVLTPSKPGVSSAASPLKNCPQTEILDLFDVTLPRIASVKRNVWEKDDKNKKRLADAWRKAATLKHSETGLPLYHDRQSGLDWWRRVFELIGQSDFLMNRCDVFKRQGIRWLIGKDKQGNLNWMKVISGDYT